MFIYHDRYTYKSSIETGKQKQIQDKVSTEGNVTISTEIQTVGEDTKQKGKNKIIRNRELQVVSKLNHDKGAFTDATNSDGNTILHITVGLGRNNIVKEILQLIEEVNLPKMINLDGSTALHIAAIIGNIEATTLLVKKKTEVCWIFLTINLKDLWIKLMKICISKPLNFF
uniref:PGG domain-containing protein n=1 Tax=Lactuca sativa TaxID=4236 RepID=A0A9R1UXA5_LACSA|nr:hypothetical protein LSAT_V11C700362890 [Lactuca sativa]